MTCPSTPVFFFNINNEECFHEPFGHKMNIHEAYKYCKSLGDNIHLAFPYSHNLSPLANYLVELRENTDGKSKLKKK